MSLVLEALRRVEKPDDRTGTIGAMVPSYRPVRKRPSPVFPLILGLGVGVLIVAFAGPRVMRSEPLPSLAALDGLPPASAVTRQGKGRAGLPPPLYVPPSGEKRIGRLPDTPRGYARSSAARSAAIREPVVEPTPGLVLQAISERDSKPIAVINDQLVREGDRVGAVRVIRIGTDTVEVLLPNGTHEIVRFAPPPPPATSPTP
jgi:hypothetical protein